MLTVDENQTVEAEAAAVLRGILAAVAAGRLVTSGQRGERLLRRLEGRHDGPWT